MNGLKNAVTYSVSLALLFIIGIAVYFARNLLAPLGTVLILCLIVGVIVITLAGICFTVLFLHSKLVPQENIEIGQYGNYYKIGTTFKPLAPLTGRTVKEIPEKIKEEYIIPTLKELLLSGKLLEWIKNGQMLLGFRKYNGEVIPRLGTFEDIRTCAVGGKSRFGKTVTMFCLVIQAILSHAKVYLCDTNWVKPSSFTNLLLPLIEAGYVVLGRNINEIAQVTEKFENQLDGRMGGSIPQSEWNIEVLVIDEWTSLSVNPALMKKIAAMLLRIANMGSGYNMYAIVGSQNWNASLAGGNALRDSMHSSIVHKLESGISSKLLDRSYSSKTTKLQIGHFFLKDTTSEVEMLVSPLGVKNDSALVLRMLEQGFTGYTMYNIPSYQKELTGRNDKLLNAPSHPVNPPENADNPNPLDNIEATALQQEHTLSSLGIPVITEHLIISTALAMKQEGVINGNGKIIRTKLQQKLGYNTKEYQKYIMPVCDKYGL